MLLKTLPILTSSVFSASWTPTASLTTSWPGNSERPAGAIVEFSSDAGSISDGSGTCQVTVATNGVNFAHFFDAHVGLSTTPGEFTLAAHGDHQDDGKFVFMIFADDKLQVADFSVTCQNDTALTGPVLDSFPQDPAATSAVGSFTWEGALGSDSVVLDFGAGNAPMNFTMHDSRLTTLVSGDTVVVSGLDTVNFQDVYFNFNYGGDAISAYEIGVSVV